ncbi:uncharacterized protein TNCT_693221 [Trichonephila clavata]|uniref:Uncharacterized protein n=1 Tax=Trichonephila clavata TaxID=2740835 RepID=A0A8X6GR97_TRICU|nr:uncharacterized protein TNCT_693221 [Trichonephila clavata]
MSAMQSGKENFKTLPGCEINSVHSDLKIVHFPFKKPFCHVIILKPICETNGIHFQNLCTNVRSSGSTNYEYIAELATRPMAENFDVFTREDMVRVYANYPAIYAYSEGNLTKKNAERLAIEYVNIMENSAKATVVPGDYTSKFTAITNGSDQFLKSMGNLTVPKMWQLAFYYHHQWLLTGVELYRKNHLYNDCINKANLKWNETDSESDSSSGSQ